MKKYIYISLISITLTSLTSCKKFLDSEVKTEFDVTKFGNTPTEASYYLNQAYSELRSEDNSYFTKYFTTDYTSPGGSLENNSSIVDLNYDASEAVALSLWSAHYGTIQRANLVILKCQNGLANNPSDADKASWNKLLAQARFIRAFLYFDLVRLFRNIPIIDVYFTDYKDYDKILDVSNAPADQMKVQELKVYDFIISDIDAAIQTTEMPDVDDRGKAGKLAVQMLRAKVYLQLASIEKFRDKTGDGVAYYNKALTSLNTIISSGRFSLKTYFPDNFIRDKQHLGNNEALFWLEYNAVDNFYPRAGNSGGFNNAGALLFSDLGLPRLFLAYQYANDFGISAFDYNSPGDIVRRFWTMESGGTFQDMDTNGDGKINNTKPDAPYGSNSEVFLVTTEPYQFTRPYWFELFNKQPNKSFRYNPASTDVAVGPNGSSYFTTIFTPPLQNINTSLPQMRMVKFRRNPLQSSGYTDTGWDADMPVYRYSEVLLMYAEVANELGGPSTAPAGGTLTALQAVNLVRDRARNFVYIPGLTVNSKIIDNSTTYTATYGDIFKRVAKAGTTSPPLTDNAADTLKKYYEQISAFRGIRELTPSPAIRNFKEFTNTQNFVPDFTTTNQVAFRDQLLDERWRELAFEFNSRWFDLTRMGLLIDRVQMTKNTINPLTKRDLSQTYVGLNELPDPNPKYYYLPIPLLEIAKNPKLNQNKGY
ncbi:RagB/SusD family nutrient uptake outer membrane protein [Pelobium sp.]|nr:RagB/SusD family nutrient uptake outer membrane protein [Pelobium sp.]MDA9555811.1 RagB/SusD family nutrient uptake outer membrane protein [Pelobium sp.]